MERSFLEFELDFFRNFFSTTGEDENDFNNGAVIHQKSILSPYSIGVCLCYLISMIKSNKIREKVAKELIGIDLKDFTVNDNSISDDINTNADLFLKEVFDLIYNVEDHTDYLSSAHDIKANYLFSKTSSINPKISNTNESNSNTSKRKFYSANLAFSVISPILLSPESEFLQNSNFIKQIDYTNNSVHKIINKTIKRSTFGHIYDLMNPLMHFTDNSLALSSLLYFEDSFHEDNCFDSVEVHIFHTFAANNRRRKSTISGQKAIKCQHNESHNLCLSCLKSEQRLMTSSQSFTSLYQYTASSVKVQMMKMTGKKPLCNDKSKNYFAIELPTSDSKFSLVCVIPRCRGEDSFSNMIQNMTIQEYRSILDNMEPSSFDICLPFFSFDTESFDLISPLSEFELDKIYLYNNELSNASDKQFTKEEECSKLEQKETKKKKKNKKDKISKEKRKKKSSSAKSSNKNNSDERDDDSNENDATIISSNTESNNENNNNNNYFYCPHCGARKIRNESMIGQECMIKNIKLNEDAFLHHFRQKCHFSVNLNGIGQRITSESSLPRSNSASSLSSSSSVSAFDLNPKNENNQNADSDKDKPSSHRDTKSKGKEKKKKDNQPKKIFDHPFIFFLTRRNPDIIIQYGVVTLPTLQDESFLL